MEYFKQFLQQIDFSDIVDVISLIIYILTLIVAILAIKHNYKLIKAEKKYAKKSNRMECISYEIELIKYELHNLAEDYMNDFSAYQDYDEIDKIIEIEKYINEALVKIFKSLEVIKRKLISIKILIDDDKSKEYEELSKVFDGIKKEALSLHIQLSKISRVIKEILNELEEGKIKNEVAITKDEFEIYLHDKVFNQLLNKNNVNVLCEEVLSKLNKFELSIKKYLEI